MNKITNTGEPASELERLIADLSESGQFIFVFGVGWWTARRPSGQSVGTALKLPRRFEGILDGTGVATGQVGDNHHVLDVLGRDAKGSRELPQYRVAVVEIGADHQMHVVKLARDQPAVVPPFG